MRPSFKGRSPYAPVQAGVVSLSVPLGTVGVEGGPSEALTPPPGPCCPHGPPTAARQVRPC